MQEQQVQRFRLPVQWFLFRERMSNRGPNHEAYVGMGRTSPLPFLPFHPSKDPEQLSKLEVLSRPKGDDRFFMRG